MYLAIDIGGTFTKYAVMSVQGEVFLSKKVPTVRSSTEEVVDLIDTIYNEQVHNIEGIAISLPGTIDVDRGIVYYGGSLPFLHEVNLKELVSERCQVPVSLENDGKCAALAEHWKGSTKGYANSVVLVFGTGVGGGIIINNQLLRGANLSAGEISWVIDRYDYEAAESRLVAQSCSATKMINKITELKGLSQHDGKSAFKYINNGDEEALAIFKEFCSNAATQILNLQCILDPEVIAIGGGISAQPILLEEIKNQIVHLKETLGISVGNPNLVICEFRNAANLAGALYHHLTESKKLTT